MTLYHECFPGYLPLKVNFFFVIASATTFYSFPIVVFILKKRSNLLCRASNARIPSKYSMQDLEKELTIYLHISEFTPVFCAFSSKYYRLPTTRFLCQIYGDAISLLQTSFGSPLITSYTALIFSNLYCMLQL